MATSTEELGLVQCGREFNRDGFCDRLLGRLRKAPKSQRMALWMLPVLRLFFGEYGK